MNFAQNQVAGITAVALLSLMLNTQATATEVSFQTSDEIHISATVAWPRIAGGPAPAVIFIHQGGSSKEEWVALPIFARVASLGVVALAYDVRGHGKSGGEADFSTLFDDPNQAPLDLQAAIAWLASNRNVDMARVAVVGASIGANLACAAAGSSAFNIKTAVAMSGKTSAVYNLAGGKEQVDAMSSVFLISSEKEQDGARAEWARELYAVTAEPRRLEIVPESFGHGVSIFDDDPTLQDRIVEWLQSTL